MTTLSAPSPAAFRARFPVLADAVHLASCSLGPRSSALDAAMTRMLDVLRDDPTPWDFWLGQVLQARDAFAALVNADPARVAVVPSATVGAYQVASTRNWSARPGIVAADVEYPSVAHTWAAQQARGATVRYVPETGPFDADECTGLVSVPLVSYRTGATLPVAEIVARARAAGAVTFVDAYQAVGVLPVDVAALGCDFLVSGTMKYLLGLPGIAFLYARAGVIDDLEPQLTGFFGRANPLAFDPFAVDYPGDARRYQVTMPTLPAALAATAGLGLVSELDLAAVERHVADLARRAAGRIDGVAEPAGPFLNVPDPDPMGLARFLNQRRIFPARGTSVRLSFHWFNDESDVDAAIAAIEEWRQR